jgi:hypothetical protein
MDSASHRLRLNSLQYCTLDTSQCTALTLLQGMAPVPRIRVYNHKHTAPLEAGEHSLALERQHCSSVLILHCHMDSLPNNTDGYKKQHELRRSSF